LLVRRLRQWLNMFPVEEVWIWLARKGLRGEGQAEVEALSLVGPPIWKMVWGGDEQAQYN
jgi:hypothetical protein